MIKICSATTKDKEKLLRYLKHYTSKEILNKRTECYLTHNFTIIAKDKEKIAGMLQWHVKEDPKAGLAEFEEVHVLEEYRCKGIGTALVKFAITSVKNYFKKIKIRPRKIFLFVEKENTAGRKLYEKNGFKKLADAGNLFHDESIELIYDLKL